MVLKLLIWRWRKKAQCGCLWRDSCENTAVQYVEIKGQLDATDWFFIAKLIVLSTCFGHHYVDHQELKSYTDGCCLWYLAFWFTSRWSGVELWIMFPVYEMLLEQHPANPQLHTRPTTFKPKTPSTTGSNHMYNSWAPDDARNMLSEQ